MIWNRLWFGLNQFQFGWFGLTWFGLIFLPTPQWKDEWLVLYNFGYHFIMLSSCHVDWILIDKTIYSGSINHLEWFISINIFNSDLEVWLYRLIWKIINHLCDAKQICPMETNKTLCGGFTRYRASEKHASTEATLIYENDTQVMGLD